MTLVHYEDYPYPPPRKFRGPIRNLRHPTWPNRSTWSEWFDGGGRKRVLVVGCGTEEAVLVAVQEPLLDVVGIDHSAASIALARALADREGVDVVLVHSALTDYASDPFDAVLCHNVLHHISDTRSALNKVRALSKSGAVLSVAVYGAVKRGFVLDFCAALRALGLGPDARGVAFVRRLMDALPREHPARVFFDATDRGDAQVADLWLHPYFRQYQSRELVVLVERCGFKFARWTTPGAVSVSLVEDLAVSDPDVARALEDMSVLQREEVGQVLCHDDAQLGAAFRAV